MKENYIHYCKFNKKNRYRLIYCDIYSQYKGYYVLLCGKYKVLYVSISFMTMIKFIKEQGIPFYKIHLNNMTLDDLGNYCDLEEDLWGVEN